MFAILNTGGKQYMASPGKCLCVEKLDFEVGQVIDIDKVSFCSEGSVSYDPYSTKVSVKVLEHKRMPKVIVFKKRRRKSSKVKKGHRQYCTVLRVLDIKGGVANGS